MPDAMIRLEHLSKTFAGSPAAAVADLSLEVERGSILTLVGPSGCGKTTTLKMINRIIEPTSGAIWIDGADVTTAEPHELRRSIGYVIQQIGLFPHRTVRQNVATVPALLGWEPSRIADRVDQLIEVVGLDPDMLDRFPSELSGGQQQRVGVARALAADPPVMLMDEPFGAVDPIVRARLQDELVDLQSRVHKTIVFVTHDIDEAIRLGDRMCILNVGGVVEQIGPPADVLAEPANAFVEDFLGGERGLKRLGLLTVNDIHLLAGPTVEISGPAAAARAVAEQTRSDWVGFLDRGKLLGWLWTRELPPAGEEIDPASLRAFLVTLSPSTSLRKALDAIVTSHSLIGVAVDDDGSYAGLVTLEAVAGEVSE